MTLALQGSLLDCGDEIELGVLGSSVRRTALDRGAWIDLRPGWVTGSDVLFDRLVRTVPWHAERRHMYDRMVDVPRLLKFYGEDEELPEPILREARDVLTTHYARELVAVPHRRALPLP
jgi:hypothetical protein